MTDCPPDDPALTLPAKADIVIALRAQIAAQLQRAHAAAATAFAAATHEEARPENKYDTRALEQSYLSAGQAARIAALRGLNAALHTYQPPPERMERVGPGALVVVEHRAGEAATVRRLFIVPLSVGELITMGDVQIHVVDAHAPMPLALRGREEGDVAVLGSGPKARALTVLAVR